MAGLSAILLWFSRSSDFTLVRSMTVIPAACSFDLYGSFDGSICPSAPSLSLRTAQRETFTRAATTGRIDTYELFKQRRNCR